VLICLPGAVLGLTTCSRNTPPPAGPAPPAQQYRLTATIQDLMDGIIDPSADVLWDSVAYIASTTGIADRQARTDEEWKQVRNSALTLVEAANLLSMPGRSVAKGHAAAGMGELTPDEIQQQIGATHPAFAQFARNLQDAGLQALAAIDAKDA